MPVTSGIRHSHPDEYSSEIRFPIGNWSLSFIFFTNGSNALGRNRRSRIHDKYSPGLTHATCGEGVDVARRVLRDKVDVEEEGRSLSDCRYLPS